MLSAQLTQLHTASALIAHPENILSISQDAKASYSSDHATSQDKTEWPSTPRLPSSSAYWLTKRLHGQQLFSPKRVSKHLHMSASFSSYRGYLTTILKVRRLERDSLAWSLSTAEFTLNFWTLADGSGWNEPTLKAAYHQGLNASIIPELACWDDQAILHSLIDMSVPLNIKLQNQVGINATIILVCEVHPTEPIQVPLDADPWPTNFLEGKRDHMLVSTLLWEMFSSFFDLHCLHNHWKPWDTVPSGKSPQVPQTQGGF